MEIQDQCFEYLRSVNPIAQKIAEDIDVIKEKNKTIWSSLDIKSKDKIIDDELIDYCLVQKYECSCDMQYEDLEPISNFSWFSRSQLNLFSHINVKPDKNKTPLKRTDILSPQKKTKNAITKVPESGGKHIKKSSKDEKPDKICSKGVAKPKTPPPPPPAKLALAEQKGLLEDDDHLGDDIPKTGFDFLDNWWRPSLLVGSLLSSVSTFDACQGKRRCCQ